MKLVTVLPPLACGTVMFLMAKMMRRGGLAPGADAEREALRELERLRAERDRLEKAATDG